MVGELLDQKVGRVLLLDCSAGLGRDTTSIPTPAHPLATFLWATLVTILPFMRTDLHKNMIPIHKPQTFQMRFQDKGGVLMSQDERDADNDIADRLDLI